jgi:tRNA modification GTPase
MAAVYGSGRPGLDSDTIAALASPLGRGGVAVIRISGEKTLAVLRRVFDKLPAKPIPRHAYHGFVSDGGKHIDEGLAVFFNAPHSYTGEDVAEISIHSNPFLVEEVLNLIFAVEPQCIRAALPGEFTFRAFKNGKMDLIQAEAVNELINANSRYYVHMKFGSLEGRLSKLMARLREDLIDLGVLIETKIEFEEDQFFDEIHIAGRLDQPLKRLDALLANARFNDLLNKGINVAIVGKANVGKSSLFNALLMEERSIISPTPGTTRDFIREKIYIDGFPIQLTDVAGINRETSDDIEAQGMRRSLEILESCDAAIFVLDASRPLEKTDRDIYDRVKNKKKLIIANKRDIMAPAVWAFIESYFKGEEVVRVSVKEHENIDAVTGFLKAMLTGIKDKEAEFTVNRRQKQALEELRQVLCRVREMMEHLAGHAEIAAEEIRRALDIIGRLTGEITPEDILDKIFSEFCVGK